MAGAQANIYTYLAPLTGSGRTAPALLEDITLYDPHLRSLPDRNLLADPPINFAGLQYLYQFLPEASCRHGFRIQPRQTKVPNMDERPSEDSIYQVTAVCQHCRIHICLKVDYTTTWKGRPCPNEDHPVHHLIRSTYRDNLARSNPADAEKYASSEIYCYQCSSSTCSAVVTVYLSPEVLREESVHILTDPELLKQRTDEAFAAKSGDTEGMRRPSATDVLTDLRTYIRNSWKSESKSEISLDNKRFAVRFGPGGTQCAEVLESLAFVLKPEVAWQVPKPVPDDPKFLREPFNIFLDNIDHELSALILNRPLQERQISQDQTKLYEADLQFARILGCQDYDRSPESRRHQDDAATRPVAFTVLGVPQDLSDEIISCAYDWQCAHHVQGAPHYLSSLQSIARQRHSESLETRCAIEMSNGRVTYEQLVEAYKALGLSMQFVSDDDHIIGTFESRMSDARNQEPQLREHLKVIGVGLNSKKIIDYASKDISTYEQALSYLGVTHDTPDEFIQSMYTAKIVEHVSQQEMAAKAVKLIAMHRRSEALQAWITSGFSSEVQTHMDIGEAYQTLEISDRTVDDDTILAVYTMRRTEVANPERFTRALTAIAQSRNSHLLTSELEMSMPDMQKARLTEPVGLDNIGNTCYLNSLLQFLFTIKIVRDVVIDFDQYKMEVTPDNMAVKKVGQRKISSKEVETAQKFAVSLAGLFQSMITAPKTAIRPEQELARLTLETDQVKEKIRRRSTLAGGTRPSLGVIDNREIQGPLLPTSEKTNVLMEEAPLLSPEDFSESDNITNPIDKLYLRPTNPDLSMESRDDNSSEATLVSQPNSGLNTPTEFVSSEQQQAILDNKENLAPSKVEIPKDVSMAAGEPLRPASPSKINAQAGALASEPTNVRNDSIEDQPIIYQPPPGPPPIPPRKPVQNTTMTLEEYARQQDVTEVVGHCLFQLSCAMRPTGFDDSGEQQDEIHNLFFGESRGHTLPAKATPDTPLPFLNILAAVINQPKDMYAALDNHFDLADAGNGREGYVSITKLPPVLTVTLGRVVWDSKSNSQKKLDHHVELTKTLYMDRYLETEPNSSLMEKREQSWKVKQELITLAQRKVVLEQQRAESADVPSLFDDARRCLEYLEKEVSPDPKLGGSIDFDPNLKYQLGKIADQKRAELEAIKQLMILRNEQLNNLFTDMQSHPYKLHAAFFHRGSHGSGHYWVYIIDHKTNTWRKYNDDHVTIVNDLTEIFGKPDVTGSWSGPANPYFLVYVQQGQEPNTLEELVETVKREPLYEEEGSIDGIDIEPLGSGSAVAKGLMAMTSGRAHSQVAELPPETAGQNWPPEEPVPYDVTDKGYWAGEGLTATGQSTSDESSTIVKEGTGGGWHHTEANVGVKW